MSTVALFVLINGFVLAILSSFLLFHETRSQKEEEARNLTDEVARVSESVLADMEKTVRALGYFYASMESKGASDMTVQARRVLTNDVHIESLLWTTESGVHYYDDVRSPHEPGRQSTGYGYPDFSDLYRETFSLSYNQIGFLDSLPWPVFNATARGDQKIGLVMKAKTKTGGTGILLVVTSPKDVFGDTWSRLRRESVANITLYDHLSGRIVIDSPLPASERRSSLFFKPVNVTYGLQLGNKAWDMQMQVLPTAMMRFLAMAPWMSFLLISIITLIMAVTVERKRRHDQRIAEMSRTLAGAHHEIQTKTSERDKLFQALRKSEREYRAVINSVSDVIFETDESGRLIFLNETWKRVTDREVSESVGQVIFDLLTKEDRHNQQLMFDELVRGERQAYRTETYLVLGPNKRRAVEVAFSMLRMTEDKNLRVVGTITDIEKRRRAEDAMREAEQRYRGIYENSISGIYQTSPGGRFINANPALAEVLGYDSAEDLILSVTDIAKQIYVNPEDREEFEKKILFEGRATGIEAQVRRKDGEVIWIMESARVVRSAKGGIEYYEGSVWDVTERKEAEDAMLQARIQAEISSRSRMEFLANMSHELRTPLNAIIGFSEIIRDEVMGPIGTDSYKDYAKDIHESGNHLLKVISDILEVSKIETGNRELNQSQFTIARALKSCMTIMSSRIEQSKVEVDLDLGDDLPEIYAEELGFKQIMLNVIGNAIKFTDEGGKVRIHAEIQDSGEMVIDVVDTGIGMTEAEIRKATQPFGKVDNNFSTMKEGTGLGLTIIDSLVRLHEGRFDLISKQGEGTTARITLPAYRVVRSKNVTPFRAVGGDQDPKAS
ncbi:MAG: PAS domain-containing sensor histidine kinase [Alphaproteobacteria bacterium]|nr:PAS domain-containing sensor histidine kinase [Alphaproteobacteria bacterium]